MRVELCKLYLIYVKFASPHQPSYALTGRESSQQNDGLHHKGTNFGTTMKNDVHQAITHELWKHDLENAILHKVEQFNAISVSYLTL